MAAQPRTGLRAARSLAGGPWGRLLGAAGALPAGGWRGCGGECWPGATPLSSVPLGTPHPQGPPEAAGRFGDFPRLPVGGAGEGRRRAASWAGASARRAPSSRRGAASVRPGESGCGTRRPRANRGLNAARAGGIQHPEGAWGARKSARKGGKEDPGRRRRRSPRVARAASGGLLIESSSAKCFPRPSRPDADRHSRSALRPRPGLAAELRGAARRRRASRRSASPGRRATAPPGSTGTAAAPRTPGPRGRAPGTPRGRAWRAARPWAARG